MSSSSAQAAHSLAFRVMRLCRPSFHVDTPLRFDPCDLIAGEDFFDDPVAASNLPCLLSNHPFSAPDSDLTYRSRFLLHDPSDAIGLSGLLVLPQAFGAIYLGETFCSYISINNSSNFEARDIIIKAEIQTERQRIMLLDTSKSPVESIRAGGRYDFIVEHDVKELGAHTLVCTATYNDGDSERKYLPQFFKFLVANPLSVRTKVRVVKEITFLEACIENHTKANLYMDQVDFEPSQHWSATILKADQHHPENSLTREIFKPPILIKSGGGIYNYLYQLRSSTQGSTQMEVEGSNVLGKFQITWRTNLGEPGRLQTQQILGSPITRKEIELQPVEVPSVIILERPFLSTIRKPIMDSMVERSAEEDEDELENNCAELDKYSPVMKEMENDGNADVEVADSDGFVAESVMSGSEEFVDDSVLKVIKESGVDLGRESPSLSLVANSVVPMDASQDNEVMVADTLEDDGIVRDSMSSSLGRVASILDRSNGIIGVGATSIIEQYSTYFLGQKDLFGPARSLVTSKPFLNLLNQNPSWHSTPLVSNFGGDCDTVKGAASLIEGEQEDKQKDQKVVLKSSDKRRKKKKSIGKIMGLPNTSNYTNGGRKKQKCVLFRSAVAAAAMSATTSGIENRNRILLNEAQTIWSVNKIMGLGYDGDEDEVISRIMVMEAQDQERAACQS